MRPISNREASPKTISAPLVQAHMPHFTSGIKHTGPTVGMQQATPLGGPHSVRNPIRRP